MSESPSLPSYNGDSLEERAGRSFQLPLFPFCMLLIFLCLVPGALVIILYLLPCLDWYENFPIFPLYIVSLGLYTVMKTYRFLSSGYSSVSSLILCIFLWGRTFVEQNPCHLLLIWTFCVSSDSGKCLFTFFTVISGQVS